MLTTFANNFSKVLARKFLIVTLGTTKLSDNYIMFDSVLEINPPLHMILTFIYLPMLSHFNVSQSHFVH